MTASQSLQGTKWRLAPSFLYLEASLYNCTCTCIMYMIHVHVHVHDTMYTCNQWNAQALLRHSKALRGNPWNAQAIHTSCTCTCMYGSYTYM